MVNYIYFVKHGQLYILLYMVNYIYIYYHILSELPAVEPHARAGERFAHAPVGRSQLLHGARVQSRRGVL